MSVPIQEVFGAGGILAQNLEGYEVRPGQIALAEAMDAALRDGSHLLVEAPAGTGRLLVYAVVASWHAAIEGEQVIFVAGSDEARDQLLGHDLPLLVGCLPWEVTYAPLEGLGSYLCLAKLDEARRAADQPQRRGGEPQPPIVAELLAWAEHTETGSVHELPQHPPAPLWSSLSVRSVDCAGAACPFHERCHGRRASERARSASVVVTSYPILFAILRAREEQGLPDALRSLDTLVLDQTECVPHLARAHLGWRLGLSELQRAAEPLCGLGLGWLAEALGREAQAFCRDLAQLRRAVRYAARLNQPGMVRFRSLERRLTMATERLQGAAETATERDDAALGAVLTQRTELCERLGDRLRSGVNLEDPELVISIELDAWGRGVLVARYVDVGTALSERLLQPARSVVLCGQTLAAGGSLALQRDELGLVEPRELVLPSPAQENPARRPLLLIPHELPFIGERGWPETAARLVIEMAEQVRGRMVVMLGSRRAHELCCRGLRSAGRTLLEQAQAPAAELLAELVRCEDAILLCSPAWWLAHGDGGLPLAGMVLDKLPFDRPGHPVVIAKSTRDPRWFGRWGLPRAVLAFRRLGERPDAPANLPWFLAVLDRRLLDKPYGRFFLRSLPHQRRSLHLGELRSFLEAPPHDAIHPGDSP